MEKRRYEAPRTECIIVDSERILNFVSETTKDNFSKEHNFLFPDEERYEESWEAGYDPKESLWDE